MSIVQGGNGYPFLSQHVYDYISSGVMADVKVDNDHIPDTLKFFIEKVISLHDQLHPSPLIRLSQGCNHIVTQLLQGGYNFVKILLD